MRQKIHPIGIRLGVRHLYTSVCIRCQSKVAIAGRCVFEAVSSFTRKPINAFFARGSTHIWSILVGDCSFAQQVGLGSASVISAQTIAASAHPSVCI